ncbi:MAG TPA: J domain-containing protein [Pyrinomonadaceae bacterium]
MADYYQILGVKRTASAAEIKSAYRRLARERHPDVNSGSETASHDFAMLALAYRTLSDPQERAAYDAQYKGRGVAGSASVFNSNNPHARRMRRVAAQARWDRAVDLWLEAERRETFERTQAVFTTVTLFLSTFFVAVLKPRFWDNFDGYTGRAIVVTLFLIGVWHLATRLRVCFERYTYRPKPIQDSIMRGEEEKPDKPFTRFTAYAFLIVGYVVSIAAGLFVGVHTHYIVSDLAFFFDQHLRPDLLFYPPIAVLIVDTMHSVASKIDS